MVSEQQKLKKKLDEVFSEFIRLRDSDINAYSFCIICGTKYFYKSGLQGIHNGHFIPRDNLATRFDEENCNAQCYECNSGFLEPKKMLLKYQDCLEEKIGFKKVQKLRQRARLSVKYDINWFLEKIQYYKDKIKELIKTKNI